MLLKLKYGYNNQALTNSFSVIDKGDSLSVVFAGVSDDGVGYGADLVQANLDMSMQQFDDIYAAAHKSNEAMLDLTSYAARRLTR